MHALRGFNNCPVLLTNSSDKLNKMWTMGEGYLKSQKFSRRHTYMAWPLARQAEKFKTLLNGEDTSATHFGCQGHHRDNRRGLQKVVCGYVTFYFTIQSTTGSGNNSCMWFGEFCSCRCLLILPQLSCNILAMLHKYHFQPQ